MTIKTYVYDTCKMVRYYFTKKCINIYYNYQDDVDLVNLVQCYLSIDQPGTAARIAAGLVARDQSLKIMLL